MSTEKSKKKSKTISTNININGTQVSADPKSYTPPEGSVLLQQPTETSDFDWDSIRDDDDLELFVMRVPDSLKASHLEGLTLTLTNEPRSSIVGTLSRKRADYDVWSIQSDQNIDGGDMERPTIGGEEVLDLTCLLPRSKKGGKLFFAPKPISRHLTVSAKSTQPTPLPAGSDNTREGLIKAAERYRHPQSILKHQFLPSGALSYLPPSSQNPADQILESETATQDYKDVVPSSQPTKVKKKRKLEQGSPKQSKKLKT